MERNVNAVLDKVDAKHELIAEYATKRGQRYKQPPKAILRHIILSDFKEKVPLAPFINKDTEPILMYDPLPPIDSINIYNRPNMTTAPSRTLLDASPLSMFFQSLLPNFNVANVAAAPAAAAQPDRPAIDPIPRVANQPAEGGAEGGEGTQEIGTNLFSFFNSILFCFCSSKYATVCIVEFDCGCYARFFGQHWRARTAERC